MCFANDQINWHAGVTCGTTGGRRTSLLLHQEEDVEEGGHKKTHVQDEDGAPAIGAVEEDCSIRGGTSENKLGNFRNCQKKGGHIQKK